MENHLFKCPKCGGTDQIRLEFTVTSFLVQDGSGRVEMTPIPREQLELQGDDNMSCFGCNFHGEAGEFVLRPRMLHPRM